MLDPHLNIFADSHIHGGGIRANAFIASGSTLWTHDSYRFIVNRRLMLVLNRLQPRYVSAYSYQIGDNHYIYRATPFSQFNHSCTPNGWWAGEVLVARVDIQPGDEVTYDYATSEVGVPFRMVCQCTEPNCRRVITNLDYRLPEFQAFHGDHLPYHTLNAIRRYQQQPHIPPKSYSFRAF